MPPVGVVHSCQVVGILNGNPLNGVAKGVARAWKCGASRQDRQTLSALAGNGNSPAGRAGPADDRLDQRAGD